VPHAHHFLERLDRVTRLQTDFALSLYRDEAAVRFVLDHVRLPEDAERVALSLDDPDEGPFVIVTRSGAFVTCLARGMHAHLPTIARGQLDALLAKVADQRARLELAQRELRSDEDEEDLFLRVLNRGSRFAREDFRALSAFGGLFELAPYTLMVDLAAEAVRTRSAMAHGAHRVTRMRPGTAKALEKEDRITWAVAHLMVFAGAGERAQRDKIVELALEKQSPTYLCAAQAGTTFLLRGAWAAARFGKALIPTYKKMLANPVEGIGLLDAALSLGAIGLRHRGAMAQARGALEDHVAAPPQCDPSSPTVQRDGIAAVRASIVQDVLRVLDAVDANDAAILSMGREMCCLYGQSLPEGHPLRYPSHELVPEDIARTAVLAYDGDIFDPPGMGLALAALPTAARAQGEDFYFPRTMASAWLGEWSPDETLARMRRFGKTLARVEPRRAEKVPGRNDPCPCGSGKKWKRCHGAGA
jgi:hypothetical protein